MRSQYRAMHYSASRGKKRWENKKNANIYAVDSNYWHHMSTVA